ncbi:MAG: hypothetical protein WB493_09625 [Anaeromyxobacteraceae bacterium]
MDGLRPDIESLLPGVGMSISLGSSPRVTLFDHRAKQAAALAAAERIETAVQELNAGAVELRALLVGHFRPGGPPKATPPWERLPELVRDLSARQRKTVTPTAAAYFAIGDYIEAPCATREEFKARVEAWKKRIVRR